MNSKFEKWWQESGPVCSAIEHSDTYWRDATYKAAIQSLEVTPELCQIAEAAYDAEPATPLCDSPAMKEALQAFLSALKEQAK